MALLCGQFNVKSTLWCESSVCESVNVTLVRRYQSLLMQVFDFIYNPFFSLILYTIYIASLFDRLWILCQQLILLSFFFLSLYFRPLFDPKWNCMFGYSENVSVLWIYFAVTHLLRWQIWIECLSLEWSSMKHKIDFFFGLVRVRVYIVEWKQKDWKCLLVSFSLSLCFIDWSNVTQCAVLVMIYYSSIIYTTVFMCLTTFGGANG